MENMVNRAPYSLYANGSSEGPFLNRGSGIVGIILRVEILNFEKIETSMGLIVIYSTLKIIPTIPLPWFERGPSEPPFACSLYGDLLMSFHIFLTKNRFFSKFKFQNFNCQNYSNYTKVRMGTPWTTICI